MIDNNKIVQILRQIIDPTTSLDLIAAKKLSNLKIEGNSISFAIKSDPKEAQVRSELYMKCNQLILEVYPDADVNVHFENEATSTTPLPQVKNIIAVGSGKGGVGKSTVSVNLALALSELGLKVGILDADLYGPSVPTMLGLQGQKPKVEKVYGKNKIIPIDYKGIPIMSIGFVVEPEQAVVLRGPRLGGIIKQFLQECVWPPLDFLIIDLPPGTGDIQLTMVQTIPVTGALMVTTPQEIAVIDAVKAMNMFRLENINVPIIGVVENMSWFTPEELPDNKYKIFGEGGGKKLSKLAQAELLGQLPLIMSIREKADAGLPPAQDKSHVAYPIFQILAKKFIQQVAVRNEAYQPSQIVLHKT